MAQTQGAPEPEGRGIGGSKIMRSGPVETKPSNGKQRQCGSELECFCSSWLRAALPHEYTSRRWLMGVT